MSLNEWNNCLLYAKKVTSETDNIKYRVYTMYDGQKGIELYAVDAEGNYWTGRATGICRTERELRNQILFQYQLLLKEVTI